MTTTARKLKPFPLRVKHYRDEPAHALLLRTAAHNGTSRFSPVFKRCGVLFGRSAQLVDQDLVARLCGVDPEELSHGSIVPEDDGVSVLGQKLRHEHVGGWWRRWCPHCLEEAPYHRVWWDIAFITTCPAHGVELTSDCGCDQPLINGRQGMIRCNQNHDLTKVPVRTASVEQVLVDQYIVDRLLGHGQHPHVLLDKTSLGQAIHVLERIGVSALAEDSSVEQARAQVGVPQLLSAGFAALADYPRGFNRFLDILISRRNEDDLKSEVRAYGPLRYWMGSQIARDKRCDLISELRQAFTSHAQANVISLKRVTTVSGSVVGVPLRTAANQCGLAPEVFIRLMKVFDAEFEAPGEFERTVLRPDVLQRFENWLMSLTTMEQAIESLGVRWVRVIELADEGHLPYVCRPYDRSEPQGKRGDNHTAGIRLRDRDWNRWYFQPDAVSNFLSLMRSKIVVDTDDDVFDEHDELVELMHATTMFTSFDQVIRMVLDGTLPLRGNDWGRPGLAGLLISKSEAKTILKRERREGHPLRAAALLMGMTYNQLRSCIITKLITPVGTGKSLSITDGMIAAFKAKYVQAMEIADHFGIKSSRVVIRYLRENGLEPLQVDGELGITLYLREQAMPLAESLPPPVAFANARERAQYQKEKGLPVAATWKRHDTPQDWNKRGADRSGR
tara:strand:+ start:6886 stop:8907 length:2022 start_codon:yes stop_codon:yes gene_type:complete